jgi:hypothetical protein
MRNNTVLRLLMITALLVLVILAIPGVASAQGYNRDRYDRSDRRDLRNALMQLNNASARLESDLNSMQRRRVFGIFSLTTTDPAAIAEVRDFRRALFELRNASNGGRNLSGTYDEARMALDKGVQLDRYLRLRTGSADVDADLSEIRSSLHIIADAYNLRIPY